MGWTGSREVTFLSQGAALQAQIIVFISPSIQDNSVKIMTHFCASCAKGGRELRGKKTAQNEAKDQTFNLPFGGQSRQIRDF